MRNFFRFMLALLIITTLSFVSARYIYKTDYLDIINEECMKYDINPVEILSIIKAESDFKPDAVSNKEAYGLMQLTFKTASWCAENVGINKITQSDLYVPETNIKLGVYYYNYLKEHYNNTNTAFAAYNAGMGNVDKWLYDIKYSPDGKTITTTPYPETTRYITKINNNIKIYKFLYEEL